MNSVANPLPAPAAGTKPGGRDPALAEIVQSIFDYMPATLAGYMAGIGVIALLYWAITPMPVMASWLGLFFVIWIARLFMSRQFNRAKPQTQEDWQRWRIYANLGTFASGILWGTTAWIFYPHGDSIQQVGLIILVYTFCVAAVPVLSTQPRVYLTFAALSFVPLAVRIASEGTVYAYQLAGVLLLIMSLTTVLARRYRQALQRVIDLKLHADELLAQLRVEKQAADTARREAEVANRSKTQFFTAASHDLRQPLHAMGLFAEALRNKSHDDEVAHLVNSINASVDALEELFSELLDITRIDSGGVAVNPQHFEIGDIFRKLRLHFEPTAFEKGLALRLRGGKHMVHADPLLVERVLRNLVSNAIRYTQDGTVLVGCRRRGERVLLQVWDTGPGISEQEQTRIFDEFYQVPGSNEANTHERKGLGLGLSIVKRLSALMDAPLTIRSKLGRGTVFTFELAPGKAVPATAPAISSKGPLGLTLEGRLIVIVEDEPAVRSGLEALLRGWGATIASFDSVDGSTQWANMAPTDAQKPDLLIVDYRLENGRNGVEAITLMRQRFGPDIPAIVVTGSTMTGHDREAQEKNFHLLIKPVVPNKLRAMIAFKLGVKGR
ncbi:ATP-binding response regulator [Piscinibacter terrae]|uniref:histidine kinase n=1 Tax=Piscinibacter terrae TaxID=2496871 RepID=A0A3N7J621_9BURK|nr:ATP-binding protein [Albitalea terrae]RQP26262.1 response regulator [Albitalea terrae]